MAQAMFYTHGALERADHLRNDAERIAQFQSRSDTRWIPVWRGSVLVTVAERGRNHPRDRIASMGASAATGAKTTMRYFSALSMALPGLPGQYRHWMKTRAGRLPDKQATPMAHL